MQIGIFSHIDTIDAIAADLRAAQDDGISSYWLTQGFGHDALNVISAVGRDLPDLQIGTAVIPVQPRHPMVLAQAALSTNQIIGGRLVVGLGPSHPQVVEPCWGLSYDKPARYVREYLQAFNGALTQHVRFRGEVITARGDLTIAGDPPVPTVMVAALGPLMLKITGELASGTITWMVGPKTLSELTVPTISEAAAAAGRPHPEIVVTAPICMTSDAEAGRRAVDEVVGWYDDKPAYRAALDREGFETSHQMALIGTEDHIREGIARYEDAGATTFAGQFYGTSDEKAAGRELFGRLAAERKVSV